MNSAKEKAIELISKFKPYADYQEDDCFNQIEKMLINSKKCALIAVEEILDIAEFYNDVEFIWWEEVKQEILKL
jgi:hypothetical protein